MNNIIKNVILAFTLVCVIVLIVFCIQLLVINRGVEPKEAGSTISGDSQQEDEEPEEDEENVDGDDADSNIGGFVDPGQEAPRPPPQGIRRELLVAVNKWLVIYAREELFDFQQGEIDWLFKYTGEGGAGAELEISFTFVTGQGGVGEHAQTFLNNYSGGSQSEYSGEEVIHGSSLRGYHVSAQVGTTTYEAWIHALEGSDLALVLVINYTNDRQRDALYEVLSTLDMISHTPSPT